MSTATVRQLEWVSFEARERFTNRLGEVCLLAMIFASITLPPIRVGGADFWLKAEQIALPLVIAIYFCRMLAGAARVIPWNGLFVAGALYSLCIPISIWYGAEFLRQTVIVRDFYEVPKVWLPVLFFTVAYEVRLSEAALKRLFVLLGIAAACVCFYAWAQWAGLSLTYVLNDYYSAGNHDDALFGARRVYSTVGNPNILGQLLVWCLAAFLLAALNRIGSRIWNISLATACLITLAMTGSRYGLIAGGFTILLAFALPATSRRQRLIQIGLLLLLVPLLGLTFNAVATSNQHTLERFQTLRRPLEADSLRERLDALWLDALDEIEQSPIFGRGPAKTVHTGVYSDSEYLDVLKQFGVLGFLPYLAFFLLPLYLIWKGLRTGSRAGPMLEAQIPATFTTVRVCLIMIVVALLMNIGMSTFYNAPIQGFLWMWMGIGARCAMTIREAVLVPSPTAWNRAGA
jgi:O-antigen ligase